jgi:outer membrane protein assembly factor BamB
VWETATDQLPPGGSGGFYSSPALAAGKLFIGRDDGAVFALDLRTGARVWSKATGGAVIGSPALAKVAGTPLTAYIGSYDRYLYAFDAADGDVRWRYDVKGPIPGTPTVIGTTVYTSSFKTQEMVGVSAKSGREVFHFAAPGYTPMISDGQRLFLIGYESVRALEPK